MSATTATSPWIRRPLAGAKNSAIKVKYVAASARWQLVVTSPDSASPLATALLDNVDAPSSQGDGNHLALVYNAVFGDALLYVNGTDVARAAWDNTWDFSATSLQVGRALTGTAASEYFSGAIDEVRMYQGPLNASVVATVAVLPGGDSIDEIST
ncbi:LamG-like jellyroll fold domain-containing protein [Streptomyces sp. NPDC007084]|uniref:LamG-like jellyroll fold domain-containing protein n=1 Tax=Streptomyces sp. NPDC007084 TaxID=3154313 RepID=UPI003453356B